MPAHDYFELHRLSDDLMYQFDRKQSVNGQMGYQRRDQGCGSFSGRMGNGSAKRVLSRMCMNSNIANRRHQVENKGPLSEVTQIAGLCFSCKSLSQYSL
jgi:hypothetical protein